MVPRRTLLINANYIPLSFITETAAIILLIKDKAELISEWDETISTSTMKYPIPAVIRLKTLIKRPNRPPRFTRRVLFNRDNWCCAYCGKKVSLVEASVDHVVPRSIGGRTSWLNCVTACKPCNKRKANKTPDGAGMKLLVSLKYPNPYHIWDRVRPDEFHPDWVMYSPCGI
jgi:5-methylcytosine-specific restriction endonuclease McrA